ncbi:transcription factor ATF2 [Pochonia chlamydosporia 170]|uniref:Transcription factor ATF2 n=1 Tax=Pochonia chlamydosporia 170 TaxID=1380566 RepID=A0A179F6G3_METCM|nr:transcription factor ATF2 [Pochonia chlamydosporia 170]OAQ60921.1 transcription factor ATF2 [Pochonia chlamydosporia 170]
MSDSRLLDWTDGRDTDFDALIFGPNHQSIAHSPQPYPYDYDAADQALPCPLSGLSEHKYHGVPFANQLGGTERDLYSFNARHRYYPITSNPVLDTASSMSTVDSKTPPSSVLSVELIPKEPRKTGTEPKTKPITKKQNPRFEKPARAVPRTRGQSACKANNNQTKEPKETTTKNRREGAVERNRVTASNCRKRKKQWTENLEEKKSGLEAIHGDLQAEYMNLLQESSQLKNLLISHASCQHPDIDIWIKNEASKYVHNLHSPQSVNILCSVPSLDENGSTARYSTTISPATGSHGSRSQDLISNDFLDEKDGFEDDVED